MLDFPTTLKDIRVNTAKNTIFIIMILRKCSLDQVDLNYTHKLDTSLKLKFSNGHNLLKFCPNWAYEVFLTSTKNLDVKKYLICPVWTKFE